MTVQALDLSDTEHDAFVRDHPNGHLMQTTAWGREKEHTGWSWRTVAVGRESEEAREVTGVALLLFRRLPVLPFALCYLPRGPVLDWSDEETLDALLDEVRRVAAEHRGVTLRIDPAVRASDPCCRDALERRGFARTDPGEDAARTLAQPALRMVTDISDIEALHQALPQGTRWSIRKSARSGLVYESVGREKIPAFYELMRATGERDGFGIRSLEYFTTLYDLLSPTGDITVSLVRLDPAQAVEGARATKAESHKQLAALEKKPDSDKRARQKESLTQSIANADELIDTYEAMVEAGSEGPYLAGSVFATNGTRGSYLYAASSNEHRNLRPNYLMVWQLMQDASARGVRTFDFGGIDASEGLEEFKRQWEPERVEYVGEFTQRLRGATGWLVERAVSLYKRR
ncbi:peptidoglycan bridge formation glycyltransferase FemA/FemB family protein [Phycicoccus endophyticus]|uniref:Peptidoglycan bridge formation glycyltransferase FemA/FemB family protein n=1 Tax=Phycicoccus endophyticus TaxID=1690220 RepID=A0A7G9R252_9MICO|nr:peptidoglycan bridge formation glycyltransferase FemA/FemB family protein [Phycicoccus endophyticus]NHI19672.1 aminoacyltransferase [Phycicoccus endophyticus]QNN49677.1 peptidoglycan bridge formation glycyltransferase FemA/FemB family protein [Phycicoccus endophyticus]GGL34002.1 lipid II:glycine glycyltransferase [Phycicoccus endophyticus]